MKGRLCLPPTWALVVLLSVSLLSVSCGEAIEFTAHPYGYWEGTGTATEVPMNDRVRRLTRSADFDFWFTLAEDGEAAGEIDLHYEAELTVDNLPSAALPLPGATVTFDPEVGGTITDPDPTRRFPLVGRLDDEEGLILAIATAEGDRPSLEFTFTADAGVNVTADAGVNVAPNTGVTVQKMDMTPFSPFTDSGGVIEKRPDGPFAVHFEDQGENYAIEWSARQMGGEQGTFELTPEMELELQELEDSWDDRGALLNQLWRERQGGG